MNRATIGKSQAELTQLANDALRNEPGCETARVPEVNALPDVAFRAELANPPCRAGRHLISDIDRAVITVHHRLGRKFHLVED